MQDFIHDENLPADPESPENDHRRTGGGPKSPEGKAVSSQNGLKHGCCSEKTILRHEDPAEFEFTVNWWFEHYQPESNVAVTLVQETARAHWFFKRNAKRLEEVEWNLPSISYCWTEDNHKEFNNFTRYKTTTERAFYRAFKELEAYYGRLDRAEQLQRRAREETSKLHIQWCNREFKAAPEELKITQVVEVEVIDGQTVTSCYPTNQQLIEQVAKRPKPPVFLERFVTFSSGVPSEYAWANPNELQKLTETVGVQKMTYEWWLRLIKHEKAIGTRHIGPILGPGPEPDM